MSDFLTTPQGRRIAFDRSAGQGPGVVFLGGFRSDMTGTKAAFLADWAARQGRAFVRFDYSGHGQSSGDFLDYTIGAGAEDAMAVLGALTTGPQVLVGSSMGGWISLLVARAMPERVCRHRRRPGFHRRLGQGPPDAAATRRPRRQRPFP